MISTRLGKASVAVLAAAGTLAVAIPAGADPATAASRCTTSVLSISHTRHDVGAGNGAEDIVFTNIGSKSCVLGGFPGAAYVAKSGKQLGAAADREGSTNGPITIAPGHKARARLTFINNVGAVPRCYHPYQQAQAAGERVYPPGSTSAMFLRDRHPACKNPKVHLLHIEAVRAG
ncbi:MAG: hypothetical protein QOF18_2797 [Frankiaceae bacterium]|jgi:hypothetical protein|nr:hypothetical protein [Frankiaceae bacterium]